MYVPPRLILVGRTRHVRGLNSEENMGMRKGFWALLLMCTLAALPAWAQETRGNINGVIQDAQGVIPGATVRLTNAENGQTQALVTNESGYFEAPLLQAGPYRVTVEMPNFKTLNQDVVLSVGEGSRAIPGAWHGH